MSKILDIILRTRKQGDGAKETAEDIGKAEKNAKRLDRTAYALGRTLRLTWSAGVGGLKAYTKLLGSAGRLTRNFALGTTAAIAGSIREFVGFNVTMTRAWGLMKIGRAEFRELRSQVVDLSAELGVAKNELASGFYQAFSAGVGEDDLISFLRTAAKVAVADGSTVETAVDGITTVLNAFGYEADQAQMVVDKLYKTVGNGKTNFSELSSSLSQAALDASSMGVGLDEVLASVATLTKKGVPTATAMVLIRNSLLTVNEQLGDGWAKSMTFQEALQKIAKEANYSQQALTEMFGRENVKGIAAMTGANFKNAASDLKEMEASSGSLDEAFGKVSSETSHWSKTWQSIRAYANDIGREFDERIRPAVNTVAAKLEAFRKGDSFKEFAAGLAESAVGFVEKLIAGITTAAQMAKEMFSNGPTAMAATLKVVLVEAVTLAGSAFIEFLRANIEFFLTLGRLIGSALIEQYMKSNAFGAETARKTAARKTLMNVSAEELAESGIVVGRQHRRGTLGQKGAYNTVNNISTDTVAKLAAYGGSTNLEDALAKGAENFQGSKARLGARFDNSLSNISGTYSKALGIDPRALYAQNLQDFQSFTAPSVASASGASAPGSAPTPPPTREDLAKVLQSRLGMEKKDIVNFTRMGASNPDFMQGQRDQVKAVEDAIREVGDGNREMIDKLLQALEKEIAKNQSLESRIRNLPL